MEIVHNTVQLDFSPEAIDFRKQLNRYTLTDCEKEIYTKEANAIQLLFRSGYLHEEEADEARVMLAMRISKQINDNISFSRLTNQKLSKIN